VVHAQRTKGRAIAGQLRVEIRFRAVPFAVADARLSTRARIAPDSTMSCFSRRPTPSLPLGGSSMLSQLSQTTRKIAGVFPQRAAP